MCHLLSQNQFEDRFPDEESCLNYLSQIRWPNGFVCPKCHYEKGWKTKHGLWMCASCGRHTSATSGTIFHRTRKPLTVWFRIILEIASARILMSRTSVKVYGISATMVKQRLDLRSYQTAWVWLQKLRKIMGNADHSRLSGVVRVHEFYWNGYRPKGEGFRALDNVIIAVALEAISTKRDGRIRIKMIESTSRDNWRNFITEAIEPNSLIVTDCLSTYCGIEIQGYRHKIGESNNLRRSRLIASALKTWISETHKGTVRPSYLPSYLDEFTFRFNHRRPNFQGDPFSQIMQNAVTAAPTPLQQLKSPR